jgi:hypothetical protein
MTKNEIITQLYLDKDIAEAIGKMNPPDLQEDLKSEMFLVLCEMAEERLLSMHENGYLKFFLVRTMLNMIKSDRSGFHNKFRRSFNELTASIEYADSSDSHEVHELSQKLHSAMVPLHWYEKKVLEEYADNGKNIMSLSRDTDIPYRSLMKTIKKVKIYLKHKIRNTQID